ncbi:MAG: penicillin-binding protein activator [Rhodanobacteraceae bacterium]|nr:MAG: penicillin-binding protein activator [Rhodanobacteraceae bacterium]
MVRTRLLAHLAITLAALLLLAGCATLGPSSPEANPQAQAQAALGTVHAANTALQQGHPNAALKQLGTLPASLPPDVQQQALDVTARAQLALGDRLAAARALARRVPLLPPAAQTAEHQQIVAILAGMGNGPLKALYPTLADSDPAKPYVRQALAHGGVATPEPLPQLNEPVGTLTSSSMPQGFAMPAHVALLLPATGPVAVAGAAVRDGFFAAYFHTPVTQEQRPTVKLYDTGGTADGAVAAYQKAVADGASLVVGPLGRAAVGAVFSQASLPVPVLALNHPQGNQTVPAGSAEFGLMPAAEGAQLASHMITAGLHAAIVFRGSDNTAASTFAGFKTEFESLGGQIANDIVLQPSAVDFQGQVQAAIAGSGSQTGIVALLRPTQARLLLPQLRLARSTLPVFATSMVYSGDENITADTDLDGVQFCDEPWLYDAQAGLPSHATLSSQLATADGPAARLFAFGMDAYALMPYLDWLRGHPGSYLAGGTGQLTMDTFGHVQRTPIWVQFQGGVARPVAAGLEPAPASSTAPTGP